MVSAQDAHVYLCYAQYSVDFIVVPLPLSAANADEYDFGLALSEFTLHLRKTTFAALN